MRKLLLFLLLPIQAFAGDIWYRAHDADSVILGPVCVPELAGEEYYGALDFDTASLTVTIYASGDGVDTSYAYTGGNIDDYDGTPPAWGNPTTSAIEVEADDDCIRIHIRDEVLATTSATEWAIILSDGGTLLMDYKGQVLALADSADNVADVTSALNTYDPPKNAEMEARTVVSASYATASGQSTTQADIAVVDANVDATLVDTAVIGVAGAGLTETSLSDAGVDAIWDEVMETAGDTYTARCILTIAQSQFAGTFSQLGNVRTYKDPSGATNRVVGTISGTTRSDITVTCP